MSFVGLTAAFSAPTLAASWGRTPQHQQNYAICEAARMADYINAEWADINDEARLPDNYATYLNIFLYTDRLGKVGRLNAFDYKGEPAGEIDFVESLRSSHGKKDVGPIVASRLVLLQRDKTSPVYLLNLRRTKWEVYQKLPDYNEVQQYESSESTWMMRFRGNELEVMRQADELAPTAERLPNLLMKKVDCEALWKTEE